MSARTTTAAVKIKSAGRWVPNWRVAQRNGAPAPARVRARRLLHQDRHTRGDLGAQLLDRRARAKPGDVLHEGRSRRGQVALVDREWGPELRFDVGRLEPGPHHADDLVRLAVDRDRAADHGGIAAVAALPEAVAQDDDVRVGPIFLFGEGAAQDGPAAQQAEDPRRDERRGHALRIAVAADRALAEPEALDRVGMLQLLPETDEVEGVERDPLPNLGRAGRLGVEPHQPLRVREGERPDQRGVDDGQERTAGADHQRESQRGDGGVEGTAREAARGVLRVAPQGIQHATR